MTWQRSLTISGIRMKNTTENIMRLYFGVDILHFLNVLKVEGEEDTYFLNDSIAKFIAGKTLGRDIIYVYSGGTIRREDMGIFVYNVADSKYEEVDVRRCKWHV